MPLPPWGSTWAPSPVCTLDLFTCEAFCHKLLMESDTSGGRGWGEMSWPTWGQRGSLKWTPGGLRSWVFALCSLDGLWDMLKNLSLHHEASSDVWIFSSCFPNVYKTLYKNHVKIALRFTVNNKKTAFLDSLKGFYMRNIYRQPVP